MQKRYLILAFACIVLLVKMATTREVVESVLGKTEVHGTMHLKTPLEQYQYMVAPPILRGD